MRKTMIALLLTIAGCGTPEETPLYVAPITTLPPAVFPVAIVTSCPVCDCICVAYSPAASDVYCDSDCDGWYDSVENDSDVLSTCLWDSPPPADIYAPVCALVFGKAQRATLEETLSMIKAQREIKQ